jgi:hypothetical protein
VQDVVVEPRLMDFRTEKYKFDRRGNISGWDEVRTFKIHVKNTRALDVEVQIKRNFDTKHWDLNKSGDFGDFEKVDVDTVKFTLRLKARSKKQFTYILTSHHGTRVH